jgi:hypothetical protein
MVSAPVQDEDNRGNVWEVNVAEPAAVGSAPVAPEETWARDESPSSATEPDVVEAAAVQEIDVAPVVDAEEIPQEISQEQAADAPSRGRRGPRTPRAARKPPDAQRAARRAASKPRAARR